MYRLLEACESCKRRDAALQRSASWPAREAVVEVAYAPSREYHARNAGKAKPELLRLT